jgi:hypothetical protein
MEGERYRQEPGQRQDLPREAVSLCPSALALSSQTHVLSDYRFNDDLSLEDAIHTALLTLKEGFEGVMTEKTIELGIISTAGFDGKTLGGHGTGDGQTPGFRKLTEAEVAE